MCVRRSMCNSEYPCRAPSHAQRGLVQLSILPVPAPVDNYTVITLSLLLLSLWIVPTLLLYTHFSSSGYCLCASNEVASTPIKKMIHHHRADTTSLRATTT
jgi:hypothetical protein